MASKHIVHVTENQLRAFSKKNNINIKEIRYVVNTKYNAQLVEYEKNQTHLYALKFEDQRMMTWFILQLTP